MGNKAEEKTIAIHIKEPDDLEIIENIKNEGGNLSEIVRQLLRQYHNNGYSFQVKDGVI
jgi:hypothetical protein